MDIIDHKSRDVLPYFKPIKKKWKRKKIPTRYNPLNKLQLVNRLTSSRKLLTFDGNPLEWRSFNQAYDTSSGEYSSEEIVFHLFEELKGEARSAVENILATGTKNPDIIMKTLKLRFGNKNVIFYEILLNLKYFRVFVPVRSILFIFSRNSITLF